MKNTPHSHYALLKAILTVVLALFAVNIYAITPEQNAQNMMENLSQFGTIIEGLSLILGLGFFVSGFFRMKHYGQMRGTFMAHQITIVWPLTMLLAGTFLMVFPTVLHTALLAFWGSSNPMSYSANSTSPWSAYLPVVIGFVRIVGMFSFIRGIVLISRCGGTSTPPGTMGKSLMHMFGGVLCINVVATHSLLASLLPI